MQIKTSSGVDLDAFVLVDANGQPYTANGGGGGGGQVTGNVASGVTDSGNPVKIAGIYWTGSTPPTLFTNGQRADLGLNIRGHAIVALRATNNSDALDGSSVLFEDSTGSSRPLMVTPTVFNGTNQVRARGDTNGSFVVNKPVTAGGTTNFRVVSAASTNTGFIKAAPGQVYGIQLSNSSASWRFLKLYNKTSAPTLASDVPVEIVGIPPGGRVEMNRHLGMPFSTGIAIAITGTYADTDTTATAVGEVVGSIQYF